jgi:hypothetical protein
MPPGPKYPAGISPIVDIQPEYQGQTLCTPSAKLGTRKLMSILAKTYGPAVMGVPRACSTAGVSEHKEGRAIDWMRSVHIAKERKQVEGFIRWAAAKDASGTRAVNARRLGIMYMVWDNRIWRAYQPELGWSPYNNCLAPSMKSGSNDTTCHRNHLHISLTWDGAAGMTSFYSLKAVTLPYCRTDWGASAPRSATPDKSVIFPKPVPAIDTRNGTGVTIDWEGTAGECRLSGDGWSGQPNVVRLPVLGQFGIPLASVASVRVAIMLVKPNAPGRIVVWGGGKRPAGISEASATKFVTINSPIAHDGTINISLTAGQAGIIVRVLGYRLVVGAHPSPSPSPTPSPTPTATPTA